jgi:hypothetical protein
MCNNYEQHVRHAELVKALAAAELALPEHQGDADLPQADDIRIGDIGPVLREAGNGVELAPMSFGFPPTGRGGPVFNFRSEGRSFANNKRCLVPASAFFEFTGKKYPKAKHRFTLAGEPLLAIVGLWRETDGNKPPAFTMLTTAPGEGCRPVPRPAGGRAAAKRVGGMDLSDEAGKRIAYAPSGRFDRCRDGAAGERLSAQAAGMAATVDRSAHRARYRIWMTINRHAARAWWPMRCFRTSLLR